MIYVCKRLSQRYPNIAILLFGLWFVVAPPVFGVHFRNLTARNEALTGTDAWIEQFMFSHKYHVALIFATMLIFGMGLIGFAIFRMVRPRLHKR